jgi:RNA-directed DNA polymerase
VRGEANPYDPDWEQYFERRLEIQMVQKLKGYRKLIDLWYEQNGKCPVCNQKITKSTGWKSVSEFLCKRNSSRLSFSDA